MFYIFGFYKFKKIKSIKKSKKILSNFLIENNIRGTIIVSNEGINGTISGKKKNLKLGIKKIKKTFNFLNFDSDNFSINKFHAFHRCKVKIKKEVVPMGIKINKRLQNGHINPRKWNKIITDKNTTLIDARKPFEHEVGTFKNSFNPKIDNFREFPKFLNRLNKNNPVAMFCTGGIRCEIASSFMIASGFDEVYQLKGGVLNYLEKVEKDKNLWEGECFVFDERVSLDKSLKQGKYVQCFGCRRPLSKDDLQSEHYQKGVSCSYCYDVSSDSDKERFAQRQKQIELAELRGHEHMGTTAKQKK